MTPAAYEDGMLERNLGYAAAAAAAGRPLVGIMCEYTPREMILAAGALPACLCGGSHAMAEAAGADLPANLCPLIRSSFGFHREKANPFLEQAALVIAETTCDGKKKMYELMGRTRAMQILQLPHCPDDATGRARWTEELRRLRAALAARFATAITNEKLRAAIGQMNRERRARRALAELLRAEVPALTGRELLGLKSIISGLPEETGLLEQVLAELGQAPPRPELAARPRVLLTGVPLARGAELVMELLEECGGLVVAQENCTGLKPLWTEIDEHAADPLAAIAEFYYQLPCSVMSPNVRRFARLRELVRDYRADGVVELVWQACLTYDIEARQVQPFVEQELGLPYLRLETDYDPADAGRMATRIEALYEVICGRRAGLVAGR